MITLRKSNERGRFTSDWLDSRHTFSFDTYQDPQHMGFRTLRVINQDRVAPGQGFPLHPHKDMEILSFVLEGALKHRDSLGNEGIIRAGQVQRITAGSGIRHSEVNPSQDEEVHFLQIWILPKVKGLEPGYETVSFVPTAPNRLHLLASPDGAQGSATIRQDVRLYTATLEAGQALTYRLDAGRHAWLQLIDGEVVLSGLTLAAGDGAAISEEEQLQFRATGEARFLLFDLN